MFSAFAMRSLASVATATVSVTSRQDDYSLTQTSASSGNIRAGFSKIPFYRKQNFV